MKPITIYTDYRVYLRDLIEERRLQGLPCSNRWFAMKMEINSTSWLTSVLKGKKGLSKITANKLSSILKHSIAESRYFETLVAFNQARTIRERDSYYRDLVSLQKLKDVNLITENQYDFYSTWYNSVVRSLIGMHRFKACIEDFERMASMISPPITASQARKSFLLLEKLGLIRPGDQGIYEPVSTAVTSGENIRSLAVANFQQETMRLAQEALDRYARDERYIGTVTVGVSESVFKQITQLLIDTCNRIAEMANADTDADRVYQINVQAFPVSANETRRESGSKGCFLKSSQQMEKPV